MCASTTPEGGEVRHRRATWLDASLGVGWLVILLMALPPLIAIVRGDFVLSDRIIATAVLELIALGACGMALRSQGWPRAGSAAEILAQFSLAGLVAPLASAVLARSALPYRDDALLIADRVIFGNDWRSIIAVAQGWPQLVGLMSYAYASLMQQPLPLLGLLFLLNGFRTARQMCVAWTITLAATVAIFPFVPALGGYLHHGIARGTTHVLVEAAWRHIEVLGAARDGTLRALDARALEGIVTFPSFHAAAGVLLARGFWALPLLRWPALIVNVLMIASTPIIGGHYIIDVVAGVALAMAALMLAGWLASRAPHDPLAGPARSASGRLAPATVGFDQSVLGWTSRVVRSIAASGSATGRRPRRN